MFKIFGSIFKWIGKLISWTRTVVLNLIFLVIVVAIIGALSSQPKQKSPENAALIVAPSGALVDQLSYNPSMVDALLDPSQRPKETLVRDITRAIYQAKNDENISGLILRLDHMHSGGMSKVEEIGQAINHFKESGKPVVAYADSMTQQHYLLASYADEIYLNEMGTLYLTGFGVYRSYYKGMLDKLKAEFNIFRVGEYKDAVEPFTRQDMSPESREHIGTWITQLWQRYTGIIETHRSLNKGSIDNFIAQLDSNIAALDGDSTQLILDANLIDGAVSRLTLKSILEGKFGLSEDKKDINAIGMYSYLKGSVFERTHLNDKNIGLIVASGTILDGHQPEGSIGGDSLSRLIKKARNDDSLKALVIRVDSGGGSAFASEVIREEIAATKASGMPVYISMGSVAASGGYWISTPATEIWATPTSLTGSIGVFGIIPNLTQSLEHIGISSDGIGTSPIADIQRIDRPMSEQSRAIIQSSVDHIYQRFIQLVADARESTPEEIHGIAQGRVWSGETAMEIGLVDKLGSLEDVFRSAAMDLDLDSYDIKNIQRELSPQEQFVRALIEQTSSVGSSELLKPLSTLTQSDAWQDFNMLNKSIQKGPANILATCTPCVQL